MSRVTLVRHASTDWTGKRYCGLTDLPLNGEGRREADDLARRLTPMLPFDARVICSPLLRARQTAGPIEAVLGRPAALDPRWLEVDFGLVEGSTWEELDAARPATAARLRGGDREIDWPDGEAHEVLRARVAAAVGALLDDGGSWVVVTHAWPIAMATALLGSATRAPLPPAGYLDLELDVELDPTALRERLPRPPRRSVPDRRLPRAG